jgi:hypothetical protein
VRPLAGVEWMAEKIAKAARCSVTETNLLRKKAAFRSRTLVPFYLHEESRSPSQYLGTIKTDRYHGFM